MTKFLFALSFVFVMFGFFSNSYALCNDGQTIQLSCTQDLELSWTSTGQNPNDCNVGGPGWPGSSQCNQTSWVRIPSASIPGGSSSYTFNGTPIIQPPTSMSDTCNVLKPTNCNATGGYSISAAPNPVQICTAGGLGSTTISWSAPAGQAVLVYVNGVQTMGGTGSGSDVAPWIQVGTNYVFTLRKANTPTVVEATVVPTITGTTSGCTTPGTGYCGDSLVQDPNGAGGREQCDLGSQNGQSGSACSATCQTVTPATCGNGVLNSGEQCDNGASNGASGNSCSATCQTITTGTQCGNSVLDPGEACDGSAGSCGAGGYCGTVATGNPCSCYTLNAPYCEITRTDGVYSGYAVGATPSAKVRLQIFDPADLPYSHNVYGPSSTYIGDIQPGNLQATEKTFTMGPLQSGVNLMQVRNSSGTVVCSREFTTATAQTPIDIGWDNITYPNTRADAQLPLTGQNIPIYVNTGSYTPSECRVTRASQPWVTTVSANTTSYDANNSELTGIGRYVYTLSCTRNGITDTSDATLDVKNTTPTSDVSCDNSPQQITNGSANFNWSTRLTGSTCTVSPNTSTTISQTGSNGTLTVANPGNYTVTCEIPANVGKGELGQAGSAVCRATASGAVCGNGIVESPETCDGGSNCSATCQTTGCGSGVCTALCPQNCTSDVAECVGGQATIVSPANGKVLVGQPFTVNFSFRNIGNTTWSNPSYKVTTTINTYTPWRTVFGIPVGGFTRELSPSPVAGQLGGSGSTNTYSQVFTAPSTPGSYDLGFQLSKNGARFNGQCLVQNANTVQVNFPQCSDGVDNDKDGPGNTPDGKIDCGVPGAGKNDPPIGADPGCFPDGNGGGGACNPNDDDETDNTGANMSIVANPQLVRSRGTSNVTFTCDAGTWNIIGPQVNNITGIDRDTTSAGCADANVFCGTAAVANKVFPATNIQTKETYTLSCGGRTRSATISVIKINEI